VRTSRPARATSRGVDGQHLFWTGLFGPHGLSKMAESEEERWKDGQF